MLNYVRTGLFTAYLPEPPELTLHIYLSRLLVTFFSVSSLFLLYYLPHLPLFHILIYLLPYHNNLRYPFIQFGSHASRGPLKRRNVTMVTAVFHHVPNIENFQQVAETNLKFKPKPRQTCHASHGVPKWYSTLSRSIAPDRD